jgi:transcriptional regulator with XRE-family HTH domain
MVINKDTSAQTLRLEEIMRDMGWNQTDLGKALDVSQPAARKVLKGTTTLNIGHAMKLHEATSYRIDWIMEGSGAKLSMVEESSSDKKFGVLPTQSDSSNKRLELALDYLKKLYHSHNTKELCERIGLNYSYVSNILAKRRGVSVDMLSILIRKGVSANYLLEGYGQMMLNEEDRMDIGALVNRVKELEQDKKLMMGLLQPEQSKDLKQTG